MWASTKFLLVVLKYSCRAHKQLRKICRGVNLKYKATDKNRNQNRTHSDLQLQSNSSAPQFLLITQHTMPFRNKCEAKRLRNELQRCANIAKCRSESTCNLLQQTIQAKQTLKCCFHLKPADWTLGFHHNWWRQVKYPNWSETWSIELCPSSAIAITLEITLLIALSAYDWKELKNEGLSKDCG